MVGEDCPPDVRSDLDVALHPLGRESDPGSFAALVPDFTGRCRLLGKDGLCRLQAACGADAISVICRLYPRRPQLLNRQKEAGTALPVPEISMANSCEETLELLRDFDDGSPMRLMALPVSFELADLPKKKESPDLGHELMVHRMCVGILSDESLPLGERMHRFMTFLQIAFSDDPGGEKRMDAAVSMPGRLVLGLLRECAENREELNKMAAGCRETDDIRTLDRREENLIGRVLANDAFIRLIPYGDADIGPLEAGAAFVVMARMLLILTAVPGGAGSEEGISRMAAFFRMTELTDFDQAILNRLK
jgi:hypothetical protein